MAIRAKEIGSRVIAIKPVPGNAQWLRYNVALNGCLDVIQVLEVALGNECGQIEIVLGDDFVAGGVVGIAMFGSRELYGPQFPRTIVQRETLDWIWHDRGRIDTVKLEIEGQEIKFLEVGRSTISAHRPVPFIELNRMHHELRGTDFDTAILSLLPEHYILAELRAGGIVQISNPAECNDTDFLAVPEERRHAWPTSKLIRLILGTSRARESHAKEEACGEKRLLVAR